METILHGYQEQSRGPVLRQPEGCGPLAAFRGFSQERDGDRDTCSEISPGVYPTSTSNTLSGSLQQNKHTPTPTPTADRGLVLFLVVLLSYSLFKNQWCTPKLSTLHRDGGAEQPVLTRPAPTGVGNNCIWDTQQGLTPPWTSALTEKQTRDAKYFGG